MNLSKEHFDMYNEYTLNINKIKREINAIFKGKDLRLEDVRELLRKRY